MADKEGLVQTGREKNEKQDNITHFNLLGF